MQTRCAISVISILTGQLLLLPLAAKAGLWTFDSLGDLDGGRFQSAAYDVSDDGTVVVGSGWTAVNNKAFRWTDLTGMTQLENSDLYSHSSATSSGGSVAVGWVWNQATARVEAFRWTQATGAVGLGDLAGGTFESYANDVSADGAVVAGFGHTALGYQASRWTQATGQVPLGDLSGGIFHSSAFGVSRDGLTIVGTGNSSQGQEAFYWTQASGMIGLGDLTGGIFESHAEDVLADGGVIIGNGQSALGKEAFRWTPTGGMIGLGDLPGGLYESEAWGGAADGSLLVGSASTDLGREAFIWGVGSGMRNLRDVASTEYGLDLTGWRLSHALAMSADGRIIVGQGYNPDGNLEAWVIRDATTPVPEPSSLILFGLTAAGFYGVQLRRRRKQRAA